MPVLPNPNELAVKNDGVIDETMLFEHVTAITDVLGSRAIYRCISA